MKIGYGCKNQKKHDLTNSQGDTQNTHERQFIISLSLSSG